MALQNLAFQSSFFTGSLASGIIIRAFGITAAFAGFSVMALGAAVAILAAKPVNEVPRRTPEVPVSMLRSTGEGLRYMFAEQPRRSLALANIVIGLISASTAILVPKVAESVLGADALGASLLVGSMIPGMVVMTFVIASRPQLRRRGLLFFVGMASIVPQLAILGLSRAFWLSLVSSVFWGAPIGLFVTLVRQLTQEYTSAEMMGRAMGVETRLIFVPKSLLRLGAKVIGKDDVYQRLCGSLQVDIEKTKRLLGWSPAISVDEGLRRIASALG